MKFYTISTFILIGGFVSMFIMMKQQPQPIYLKPKSNTDSNKKHTINTNNITQIVN